jgi:hypothetical protein
MKKIREYIDINGNIRSLEYVEPGYFVKYNKDKPASMSTRWRMNDGSTVQIPENMWEGFQYTDKEVEE